ncbi:MAG: hypothetical protein ABIF40_01545 [archaeon]
MAKTQFIRFLGDSPKVRILDTLITGRELEYSITEISNQAEVSRATFYRLLNEMLKYKVILPTKKYGTIQLYQLNQKNKNVKELVKLYDKIIRHKLKAVAITSLNRQ